MSKNEGKGLKSFNKGFQVPDTYIIIFFCSCFRSTYDISCTKGILRNTGYFIYDQWC